MGKERKNKSRKTRIGISFENSPLEQLDSFVASHFKSNLSAAANYILKKYLKNTPPALQNLKRHKVTF